MIEKGHVHSLRPMDVQRLADGRTVIRSQCQGGCGLMEQQTIRDDEVVELRYRFGGLWFDALDVIRLGESLDIIECERCGGEKGLAVCEGCFDAGVTKRDGERIEALELRVN